MTLVMSWLEQPLAEAVGWALLHFLWQGALVGAVVGALLAVMRGCSAQSRYLIACAGLAVMALLPVVTTAWCRVEIPPAMADPASGRGDGAPDAPALEQATNTSPAAAASGEPPLSIAPPIAFSAGNGTSVRVDARRGMTATWQARIHAVVPWLVCGWLSGVVLLSLRLLLTWARIQRLRRLGTTTPAADAQALFARLAGQLRVRVPVQLALSALVEVPTVIGWLSPVILLPAGAVLGLAPVQLEALLAHELAHIRRWDYLVNLFQNVVETLLFYHPAVWWLSARIRQERENCCDDLAARVCGDTVLYVEALVRMEELRIPAGNMALAARGGQLLPRVRRLLGAAERDRLSPLWQSGAIALFVVAIMAAGLWRLTQASTGRDRTVPLVESDASPVEGDAPSPIESDSIAADGLAVEKSPLAGEAEANGENAVPPQEDDAPAGGLSAKQVIDAINKAKRALLSAQQPDGSWKTGGAYDQYPTGVSSLALLALLSSGMTAADPEIQRGLNWLRLQDPTMTYEISLMIQALAAARDGQRDVGKVASLVRDLEEMQKRQGPNTGSWSYSKQLRALGGADRSNGQFAVLGLREAQEMGVPVDLETWRRARDHWLSSQNGDGGWSYSGAGTPRGSTASMTAAGIATLVMTQVILRAEEKVLNADGTPACGIDAPPDRALENACQWLGNHFAVTHNSGDQRWLLYYLYGLERAGRLSGRRSFVNDRGQKHDWYREAADYLISSQNPTTGTWQEGNQDAIVGTSFVLMFLSKGLAPVLINKLQYGRRDPVRNVVAGNDWNRHPNDVRNLMQYVSRLPGWPKLLTWQTVDISQAGVADLQQAPILFITGSEAPQFTPPEAALLKEYVRQGGLIFADNCCRSQAFDKGCRELIGQMFPPNEAQLKKLTAEHPVFRSEFNLLDARTGEPTAELWGVTVGGRTGIIYSPGSLSCLWDKWTSFEVRGRSWEVTSLIDNAARAGANVVAFATGRVAGNKLDRGK
jgi:beta-lactamase regulating signal transducer with metallopeptidase domain